ncbi:MAG: hypothetical protein IPM63_04260 [Acidobacteriota bacterium]|nr:MAG: hypothetical protein IPM63_04260 [Acidobacteriota bacterium]
MHLRDSHTRFAVKIVSLLILVYISFAFRGAEAAEGPSHSGSVFDLATPSIKRFTSSDGLPVNSVMTIERDARGFVWFGTQDGAAVYDGSSFRVVNMPNRAASNYIYDILAASDGSIWFGTNGGGVHRYRDGKWETHNKGTGLGSDEIRALLETKGPTGEPVIWVGRRDGLSKLENGKWVNFGKEEGLPDPRIRSLLLVETDDGEDEVWIGTYGGVAVWKGPTRTVHDVTSGLPGNTVFALARTSTIGGGQTIWAGTDKGLAAFENGGWKTFEADSKVFTRPVRALGRSAASDERETIWVGFDGAGLAFLDEAKWRFLDKDRGLPNNLVYAFAETGAPDGSVWISNLTAGVSRLQRSDWRTIAAENGLPNEIVFSIAEHDGSHFIGTYGGGLAVSDGGEWKIYRREDGLPSNFVQKIARVGERLLVGTEEGLAEFRSGSVSKIELPDAQGVFEIWDIEPSKTEEGAVWLGTSGGVVKLSGGRPVVFTDAEGLEDRRVRAVTEHVSKDGVSTLWVGTYSGGLARFKDGGWSKFDTSKGLPSSRVYSAEVLTVGGREQLWVGTGGGGIAVLDLGDEDSGFEILTAEGSGLIPSDTVYQIFTGPKGRIYATTNKGVARITPGGTEGFAGYRSYVFTTADGLPDNECVSGASFIDSEGRVWVGTVSGAAVLDTGSEYIDEKADPIYIRRVTVGGVERGPAGGMEIGYDENNLSFEFVMPSGFRESATQYRTQLVGLEAEPSAWSPDTRREFSFVPSGDFEFLVWARDSEGNISGPVGMSFVVYPAWWQTWWAIGLYFLATAALVALIAFLVYRNRYNRLLEIEKVRTRIASDLHDDVGASLSKISIISEMLAHDDRGREEEEKRSLLKIAATSREVVGSMGDMVWSINPSKDNLQDTVQRMRRFASDLLAPKDIAFRFDVPDTNRTVRMDVDLRRQLYLVFKEAVNNAAKYSECDRVTAELSLDGSSLLLKISDDGKGFDPATTDGGNGLSNMRMRMESVGGRLSIVSAEGSGTTIEAAAPLRR